MNIRNILLAICLSTFSLFAQDPDKPTKTGTLTVPNFFVDCVCFGTSDSVKTRVDILVEVPFTYLKFYKDDAVFRAEFTATAEVYDSTEANLIDQKSWTEKVEAPNFEATGVKNNVDISLRSFKLVPGQYSLKVSVEDKDSKKISAHNLKIKVKNFWKPLVISDVVIINSDGKKENNKLIPNVSRMLSAKKGDINTYFEVYSDAVMNVDIGLEIAKAGGNRIYQAKAVKKLSAGTNRITYLFDSLNFAGGEYTIKIALLDTNKTIIDRTEKDFHVRVPGLPPFTNNVDKAIEEMKYIASQTDLDSLQSGKTVEERLERFNEFWKKRDPSEATEENEVFDEYFRRVNYANANFTHNIDGWKTDMGMVYILLGAPDNVDRHPFEINSKPYEVWEYYQLNKKLVFLDTTGFGDYRLLTPLTGDMYRYR